MPEPDPRIINFDGRPIIKCGNLRVNYRQAQALRTMGKEAFRLFAPQTIGICNGNAWAYDWDLSPMKRDMILAIWDFIMDFADDEDLTSTRAPLPASSAKRWQACPGSITNRADVPAHPGAEAHLQAEEEARP